VTPLERSYASCRTVHAAHGRTYYLATRLLPAWKRPFVHALYAFARVADEVVDDLGSTATDREKEAALDELARADWQHPVAAAVTDTLARWDIPRAHTDAFLRSMRQDLTESSYKTFEDLLEYMHGSAAVIGLQLLPLLEPVVPREIAAPYAADLGIAFQLTNFLRDVGEDLDRGRLYLPLEDLDAFGVTREQLEARVLDGRVRRLLAFEIARTRELYWTAAQGVRLLHPTSRPCIRTALSLYGAILDQIEQQGYPVLTRRVSVPVATRVRVAAPAVLEARRLRAPGAAR
jgi:phytoene synthase